MTLLFGFVYLILICLQVYNKVFRRCQTLVCLQESGFTSVANFGMELFTDFKLHLRIDNSRHGRIRSLWNISTTTRVEHHVIYQMKGQILLHVLI